MKIIVDEYAFDFPSAKELYKFDETDKLSLYYHGAPMMKAVDVMAEFPKFYIWIEIKHYTDEDIVRMKQEGDQRKNGDEYHIKTHLRNNLAVVSAPSTNNGLGANMTSIATLINRRNYYFVPFKQDNPLTKPRSVVFDPEYIVKTIEFALDGEQIEPILL